MREENFIKIEKKENRLNEIKMCEKAIKLYMDGKIEFSESEKTEEAEDRNEACSKQYAPILATKSGGSTGSRLGAPGWPHAKLKYSIRPREREKSFFVDRNGMDENKFKKWQSYIGKRFEENGLKFFYYIS